ncbi:putative ankyrin repeat protein [Megavirus courdo11]|uniref:Putative ankyrin repeat protein n=1 Tax=Megavirus courdo11 TaxID=1128140 RepID=K7YFK6_9VIRU|nr:putative ankyrin repeat protein [Megavirus courdo11]
MLIELFLIHDRDMDFGINTCTKNYPYDYVYKLCNRQNIKNLFNRGIYLYVVDVDLNDSETSFEKLRNTYLSNKIYIKQKYSLADIMTYEMFDLGEIEDNQYIVDNCSMSNNLEQLSILLSLGKNMHYTEASMDIASKNGCVDILDYWFHSGFELKYSRDAIEYASEQGHVNVLDWWINSGLELKYRHWSIDHASALGRLNVLDWWINSGLELKYTEYSMDRAANIDVLNWWINSGLELKYSENAIINSSYANHINGLNWWINSGLELKYPEKIKFNIKPKNGQIIQDLFNISGIACTICS